VAILDRPSCSEVRSELSAASSRWPPRWQTIIPRRPESASIRLRVPIAFSASRSCVVTVRHRDCLAGAGWTLLGRAAGRRRCGCWGFERKALDSRGRLERHRRDLELAGGSLLSRWSCCWKAPCRLSWQCVATDERSCSACCHRPQRVSKMRPLESSEQLGHPYARVVPRGGAQRCWPRSWLAAFERQGGSASATRASWQPATA
jgi:hypothetical protein